VAVTGQFLMSLDDNSAQSSYSASPTNCRKWILKRLIRVLDETPTAATMKGPHATSAPFYLTTSKDHRLTTSQGDHHAIFSPERAAPQGQIC